MRKRRPKKDKATRVVVTAAALATVVGAYAGLGSLVFAVVTGKPANPQ